MEVTISWRDSKKRNYGNAQGCPLWFALQKRGLSPTAVGASYARFDDRIYHFNHDDWNPGVQVWSAGRHRSVRLEIPGLEQELA